MKISHIIKLAFIIGILCVSANSFAKKEQPIILPATSQQNNQISGKVIDQAGPVVGAAVIIKNTNKGVITDSNGNFTLTGVQNNAIIQISYLGYVTQEITYKGQSHITVTLEEDTHNLGEVVVTALGITKEAKALGYAVTKIDAGEITKVGTPNFASALYGKASGVRITAPPGGTASGVAINIRGLNSINGNNQPMVFLNGVPIRNGNSDDDYANFGSEGRIRSNGLVDINPEDIENITILKGASATALYGSEAANGVVMITSKKAKGTGVSVDLNATVEFNTLAYLPKIQNEYGPGLWVPSRDKYQLEHNGFTYIDYNGKRYDDTPYYRTNVSYGPKYDGREVIYWDGTMRKYEAIEKDPWKKLFRTGIHQIYNLAINQGAENTSNRLSYTYLDELPNSLTGSYKKHNFSLVGNIKFNDRISVDYSANYIIQKIHNRSQRVTGAYDSFGNLFGSFVDIDLLRNRFQTSLGYKNRALADEATLTPEEAFPLQIGTAGWVRDYFWNTFKNNDYETDSRFIGSIAPQWKIFDFLTLRGRLSSDLTSDKMEYEYATERPLALHDPSGGYRVVSKNYSVVHGDVMLTFNKDLTDKINLSATVGWQGRMEDMMMLQSYTDGGLTVENMPMLNVSRYTVRTDQFRMELLKTAFMGSIDFSFGNYLFLGLTARQEKSSTLPQGSNSYFYPSVNASFIYTDAFRDMMPTWFDYGKIRGSYGIVGNAPSPYAANIVYDQWSGGGVSASFLPGTLGNEALMPEKINEFEVGLENKFFESRLGFEVSYYHRNISDMIIQQPVPVSDGVSFMWMNAGTMVNQGVEISLDGTPIATRDFNWNIFTNLSINRNKVTKLATGIDYLRNGGNFGNTGGGVNVRSYAGRPFGDLYVNPLLTVEDPNSPYYGQPIVRLEESEDGTVGWYATKTGEANQGYIGNIQPKLVGGLGTSLSYKNFSLDIMTDFRFGGDVLNSAKHYPMSRGLSTASLKYRDAEHGGLKYTYAGKEFDNGMIIPGVVEVTDANGNITYKENTTVVPSDYFNGATYGWGNSSEGCTYIFSIAENSYWKLREVAIGYDLPKSLIEKAALQKLRISVFARNLCYLYKTLDEIDPESTNGGTSWGSQAGVGYSSSPTRTFGVSLRATF